MSTSSDEPPARRLSQTLVDQPVERADAGVAGQRHRAALDELGARVGLRVVRGGAHEAAVELARADEPVEHLGADHPGVDHVGALGHQAGAVAGRQLRRGQPHVAPEADPQLARPGEVGEHARERAPDRLGDVAVDLLAVEAADVVGLEDLRGGRHGRGRICSARPGAGRRVIRGLAPVTGQPRSPTLTAWSSACSGRSRSSTTTRPRRRPVRRRERSSHGCCWSRRAWWPPTPCSRPHGPAPTRGR